MSGPPPTMDAGAANLVIDSAAAERVVSWLRTLVPTVQGQLRCTLITGGRSNLTYRLEDTGDRTWILRRPPLSGVVKSAHDVIREHRIMAALEPTDVPVPRMVGSCADLAVLGSPFIVMEDVPGLVVADQETAERELVPAARSAMAWSLVDVLGRLHAVRPADVGLAELGAGVSYVIRQLDRWATQLDRLGVQPSSQLRDVLDRLRRSVPDQRETTIVHGDFRPGNTIIGPDGTVRALIDWELCTLGDPLADVGWLLAYWGSTRSGPDDLPLPVPARAEGFPPREDVVDRYVERTGRSASEVDYYVAFGLWRLAAILTGVHARDRLGAYGRDEPAGASTAEKIIRITAAADDAARVAGC